MPATTHAPKSTNAFTQSVRQSRMVNDLEKRGETVRLAREQAHDAAFASLMRRPAAPETEQAADDGAAIAPPRRSLLSRLVSSVSMPSIASFVGRLPTRRQWIGVGIGLALLAAVQMGMLMLWVLLLRG